MSKEQAVSAPGSSSIINLSLLLLLSWSVCLGWLLNFGCFWLRSRLLRLLNICGGRFLGSLRDRLGGSAFFEMLLIIERARLCVRLVVFELGDLFRIVGQGT